MLPVIPSAIQSWILAFSKSILVLGLLLVGSITLSLANPSPRLEPQDSMMSGSSANTPGKAYENVDTGLNGTRGYGSFRTTVKKDRKSSAEDSSEVVFISMD